MAIRQISNMKLQRLEEQLENMQEERKIMERIKELQDQIDTEKKAIRALNPGIWEKIFAPKY